MDEDINNIYENEELSDSSSNEPICSRCGLRSYGDYCQNCNTPIVDKTDDEEEEYDWREHKR